jgi:hypothetical protein
MMGPDALFMPLRMIGAIVHGPETNYSLWSAGFAGVVIHIVLAVIYGGVFAIIFGSAHIFFFGAVLGWYLWPARGQAEPAAELARGERIGCASASRIGQFRSRIHSEPVQSRVALPAANPPPSWQAAMLPVGGVRDDVVE